MAQPFPLAATILAAGALGLSFVMLPGNHEMGAMDLRDESYAGAIASYESARTDGDGSGQTLALLARAYAGSGDIDKAILAYQDFLILRPDHRQARLALLTAFHDGQRMDEHFALLRDIALKDRDPALLRQLADNAFARQDAETEARALTSLSRKSAAVPDDLRRLAFILAGNEKYRAALSVLKRIPDRQKSKRDAVADDRFAFQLALDAGDSAVAEAIASQIINKATNLRAAASLIEVLIGYGYPESGLRIAQNLDVRNDPNLRLVRAGMLLEAGDPAAAAMEAGKVLASTPDAGIRARAVSLLADTGDAKALLALAASEDFRALKAERQASIIDAQLDAGQIEAARKALAAANPSLPAQYPLLAARVALVNGDKRLARKIASNALSAAQGRPGAQIVELALIADEAGDKQAARRAARHFPRPHQAAGPHLEAMARFYVRFGQAKSQEPAFAALRRDQPSPAADRAWARLAAAAGDPKAVGQWLDGATDTPVGLLYDIADTAITRRAYKLAAIAGRRLAEAAPTRRNRSYLAYIQHKTGNQKAALRTLNLIKPLNRNEQQLYAAAALASGDQRLAAGVLRQDLKRGGKAAEQALYALLASGGFAVAEPELARRVSAGETAWLYSYGTAAKKRGQTERFIAFVRTNAIVADADSPLAQAGIASVAEAVGADAAMALRRQAAAQYGGKWAEAYEYALDDAGDKDAAAASRFQRAQRGGLNVRKRIELADSLASDGRKREAEAIYRDMAARAGPQSTPVKRLLYLWGPRPPSDAMAWLELRARQARAPEARRVWRQRMVDYGGGATVFQSIVSNPSAADASDVRMAADIASNLRDKRKAAAGLRNLVNTTSNPGALAALAGTVSALGDRRTAYQAISAALLSEPDNPRYLRLAGDLALALGRPNEAYAALSRYSASRPADASAAMDLANAAERMGRYREAAAAYGRAAVALRRARRDETPARIAEAYALQRIGARDAAIDSLAALTNANPGDARARAAYVEALLNAGRAEEAKRALNR